MPIGNHPEIAARVARYLALLDAVSPGSLDGLYLVGSVALGDFQPGRSDIDFIAVTALPLSAATLDTIETVHRVLQQEPGPAFDGFYIDRSSLRLPPDPRGILPFELAGHFHRRSACFEANPATWTIWRDHGIAIRGPAPEILGLSVDPGTLLRFQRENLDHYWTDWVVAHWAGPADATLAAWGVLGVLRLAHVLATGLVPSKTAAGLWALGHFAATWHLVIDEALAVRRGTAAPMPLAHFHAALDFVAFVIAEARSHHPLQADGP
jgi:hypothetical protein